MLYSNLISSHQLSTTVFSTLARVVSFSNILANQILASAVETTFHFINFEGSFCFDVAVGPFFSKRDLSLQKLAAASRIKKKESNTFFFYTRLILFFKKTVHANSSFSISPKDRRWNLCKVLGNLKEERRVWISLRNFPSSSEDPPN